MAKCMAVWGNWWAASASIGGTLILALGAGCDRWSHSVEDAWPILHYGPLLWGPATVLQHLTANLYILHQAEDKILIKLHTRRTICVLCLNLIMFTDHLLVYLEKNQGV